MKLAAKFNALFTLAFLLGLCAAGTISYFQLQRHAREQVTENARIMMHTAIAVRTYTTEFIQPMVRENWDRVDAFFTKLEKGIERLAASGQTTESAELQAIVTQIVEAGRAKLKETRDGVFYPQTIPAFAATESFQYLQRQYPQYWYKEAALNPTNPRDRAEGWEIEVINRFRSDATIQEWTEERVENGSKLLFMARPITITNPACLTCHSVPSAAPAAMIQKYGSENGFGWNLNEIIGAQILSVPTSLPEGMAQNAFRTLISSLALVFVVTLVVLNLILRFAVVKPVRQLSSMADSVSKGDLTVGEIPVHGSDEISLLSASFNRMRRSLEKALKMLD